ncbi:PAAR domain-containing protein [Pseudomonas citronellolis]|uniref:PAAR domain-containing protein n=1 Tax=Pseudomonas citronellolis TaxID=53408 RepID=UPI002647FEA4|nr:PAAR domain-containing protein [Pseudomonas citronellolis]MDN6875655.1 PAAR domain-containing protein [Pseudomonas citronellolis]
MRALVCLGDKTTYGEVISATATWFEGNKAIAQTGDLARCSKCKGAFPIFGTAFDWSEQQPYVATGDRVLCGCPDHVVYGSTTQYTTTALSPMGATAQASSFSVPAPASSQFAKSFAVTDGETGQPLANRAYIALVDGHRKVGLTDANGIAIVEALTAESVIELHVIFQAPARELTEFSEAII